jgi:GNAT superfamily N-acetyltransferase
MDLKIESCPLREWAEQARQISNYLGSLEKFIKANNFSMMQFIDEEAETRKNHRAFHLLQDGSPVAWISIYNISPTVLRLRGLYVHPRYRRQGLMSRLLSHVLQNETAGNRKVVSFSLPHSIEFHKKHGFRIEERFIPRPADDQRQGEPLTLMTYKLTASSFNS